MKFSHLARLAGITLLAGTLAACMDVDMDIEILTAETGKATMTMTVDSQTYQMISSQEDSDFCDEGEVVENEDNVQCIDVKEGTFAEIFESSDPDEETPSIEDLGGGKVRVNFPTGDLAASMGEDAGDDPQMQAMMASMFEGKNLSISVSGGEILETNMELAEDGSRATLTIPFVDMMNGEVDVPENAYAVIQLP